MRSSSSPVTPVTQEEESSWVWPTPTSPPWHPLSPTVELPLTSPHLWAHRRQPSVHPHPYHHPSPPSPSPHPVLHPRTNTPAPKVLKNCVRSAKQRMKKRVRNVLREAVRDLGAEASKDLFSKEMDHIGLIPEGPCPFCISGGWCSSAAKCTSIMRAHLG